MNKKYQVKMLNDNEFNDFAKQYPNQNTFFQSSYWGKLKGITGWDYEFFSIIENNNIVAASLLLSKKIKGFKRKIYYAPRGFLIDYNDYELLSYFNNELVKYLDKKAILIKINPYVVLNNRGLHGNIENELTSNAAIKNLKKIGYIHNGLAKETGSDLEPRFISNLNIENQSIDDILSKVSTNHKRCLKKADKNCLTLEFVQEDDIEKLNIFKHIMQETANRRGYIDRSSDYYLNFIKVFNQTNPYAFLALVSIDFEMYQNQIKEEIVKLETELANVSDKKVKYKEELAFRISNEQKKLDKLQKENIKKEYISAGVFLGFGEKMFYLFGGNLKEYMQYNSAFYLQYQMIKYAIENDYKIYDFYGISGIFEKSHEDYGVFDFKKGFNAQVQELIGEFDYIVDTKSYFLYNTSFKLYRKLKDIKVKK